MYLLIFNVPESHVELVKEAVFTAGAGKVANYSHCAWQILGQGQFKPLKGSTPFIGQEERLEVVPEYRVEMVCEDGIITAVIEALKNAHPYETPSYQIIKLAYSE